MRWECEDSVPTATARGQPLPKSQLCAAPRLLGHPRELRCGAGQRAGKVALKRSPLKRLEAVEVEKPLDRSRSWRSNHGKHESRRPCCAAHDSGMSSDGMSSERRRGMSSDEGCADGHMKISLHTAQQFLQTSAMRSQWKSTPRPSHNDREPNLPNTPEHTFTSDVRGAEERAQHKEHHVTKQGLNASLA